MMKMNFGIILLLVMPAVAIATDWNCRNNDMEITCTQERCSISDGFTPMFVGFNDLGSLKICSYSGCWEGKGKMLKSGNHLFMSGHKLRWSGTTHSPGDFMIAFDMSEGIAVINGNGFAMPLICNKVNNSAKSPSKGIYPQSHLTTHD